MTRWHRGFGCGITRAHQSQETPAGAAQLRPRPWMGTPTIGDLRTTPEFEPFIRYSPMAIVFEPTGGWMKAFLSTTRGRGSTTHVRLRHVRTRSSTRVQRMLIERTAAAPATAISCDCVSSSTAPIPRLADTIIFVGTAMFFARGVGVAVYFAETRPVLFATRTTARYTYEDMRITGYFRALIVATPSHPTSTANINPNARLPFTLFCYALGFHYGGRRL